MLKLLHRVFFTGLIAVAANSAIAEEHRYVVTIQNIQAGVLFVDHAVEGIDYRYDLKFKSTGLAKVIFDAELTASAIGEGTKYQQFVPTHSEFESRVSGETTSVKLDFVDGLLTARDSNGNNEISIPPASQPGSVDPITGFGYMLRPMTRETICSFNIPIYDGVTTSRLILGDPSDRADKRIECRGAYQRELGYSAEVLETENEFYFTALYRFDDNSEYVLDRLVGKSIYGPFSLVRQF